MDTDTEADMAEPPVTPEERESLPSFDQAYRAFCEAWQQYGEREFVRQLLARHGNNVAQAARAAGIDRTYLYKLIRRYLR